MLKLLDFICNCKMGYIEIMRLYEPKILPLAKFFFFFCSVLGDKIEINTSQYSLKVDGLSFVIITGWIRIESMFKLSFTYKTKQRFSINLLLFEILTANGGKINVAVRFDIFGKNTLSLMHQRLFKVELYVVTKMVKVINFWWTIFLLCKIIKFNIGNQLLWKCNHIYECFIIPIYENKNQADCGVN